MMEIKGLQFHHPHSHDLVLKGISFGVNSGEVTTILGPNGSGKTTLFNCIAGLWKHQKGDIVFQDKNISHLPHEKRAKILAVVPQEHDPPFPYSVLDAVLMGRVSHVGIFSTPSKDDYLKAEEAIEAVGITHLKERAYTRISGGERQLALIARGLAVQPRVMLLDEPTAHLDFRNQIHVLSTIKELTRKENLTTLVTLHDPNLSAMFSDRVILLGQGQIVDEGDPGAVITPENLRQVYDLEVEWIIGNNGRRFIYPRLPAHH
ncbi:MAG: ABC transporter ATP-binding protein [Deltaproteobacteria bacterium]|nr:ABC transporter ATP-binding protein [Deltaproteobacteria bacterium]